MTNLFLFFKLNFAFLVFNAGFVANIKNEQLSLSEYSGKKVMVAMISAYNCHECCIHLANKFFELKESGEIDDFIVLIRGNGIIEKRGIMNQQKKYFKAAKVYFDYHEEEDAWPPVEVKGGLFGLFKVKYTPSVVFFDRNQIKYIDYSKLFGSKKASLNNLLPKR